MLVTITGHIAHIVREPGDKPVRGGTWGSLESAFWGRVRNTLNRGVGASFKRKGSDYIRKEMVKDGHMVASQIYYVRTRNGEIMIFDDRYALRNIGSDYNETGEVTASVERGK